jgi:hypothetical protein
VLAADDESGPHEFNRAPVVRQFGLKPADWRPRPISQVPMPATVKEERKLVAIMFTDKSEK